MPESPLLASTLAGDAPPQWSCTSGWLRRDEFDPPPNPTLQRRIGSISLGVDVHHPGQRSAGEVHGSSKGLGKCRRVAIPSNAHHERGLREATAHAPADHEAKPAEHLLLDHVVSNGEHVSQSLSRFLVVAHRRFPPGEHILGPSDPRFTESQRLLVSNREPFFTPRASESAGGDYRAVGAGGPGSNQHSLAGTSGGMLLALGFIAAPALWGFWTSQAGRPLFRDEVLEPAAGK